MFTFKNLLRKSADDAPASTTAEVPAVFIHGKIIDAKGLAWYHHLTEAQKKEASKASFIFNEGKPFSVMVSHNMDSAAIGDVITGLHIDEDGRLVVNTLKNMTFTMVPATIKDMENYYKIETLWRSKFARDLFGRMTW
jgi:hypothetical protein